MDSKLKETASLGGAPGAGDEGMDAVLRQARAWARKLAVGRPTAADAQALKRWCAQSPAHAQMWRRASAEWRDMGEVLQAARRKMPERPVARPAVAHGRRMFMGAAAAAASVVAIVRPPMGLWPSWSELQADYRTGTGEQLSLDLNAHVRLMLNTQTSLSVTQADPLRMALIAGEAEIRSDGGMPLEIEAGGGRLEMRAGCLEIRHLGQEATRIWCSEGEVRLHHAGQVQIVRANETVSYGPGMQAPVRGKESAAPGWRQGFVVFHDTPLSDAVAEINRYRSGRVVLMNEALANRRISGRFTIKDVDRVLALIQELYDARIRRVGDVVLLS